MAGTRFLWTFAALLKVVHMFEALHAEVHSSAFVQSCRVESSAASVRMPTAPHTVHGTRLPSTVRHAPVHATLRAVRAACAGSAQKCSAGELRAAGVEAHHFSFEADSGASVHVLGVDHLQQQFDLGASASLACVPYHGAQTDTKTARNATLT